VSVGRPSTCHRDRCAIDGPVRAGPGDPPWTLRVPITAACRRSCCTSSPWHNRPPRQGQVDSSEVQCSAVQCSAVECSHVQSNATKLSVASCSRSCWPHYNGATSLIQFASWASCPSWASRPSWPGYGRAMAGLWPGSRHHCGRAACPCMRADEILDLLAQLSIRLKVHRGEGQIGERRRLVDLEPM